MQSLIGWATAISAAAVVCVVIELMTPNGKTEKLVRFALGAFMICAMLTPLNTALFNINFKIGDIEDISTQSAITNQVNSQVDDMAVNSLKKLITNALSDIDVTPKNIEINFKEDEKESISQVECTIYIGKDNAFKKQEIKSTLKQNLGISAVVKLVE